MRHAFHVGIVAEHLANLAELSLWLEESGLTLGEAAMIQPSYCSAAADCFCERITTTVVEGDIIDASNIMVTAVYGDSANVLVGTSYPYYAFDVFAQPGDHVLGRSFVENGKTNISLNGLEVRSGELQVRDCAPSASPPGTLPHDVFVAAMLANDAEDCASELGAHDPAWVQIQGDCFDPANPGVGVGGAENGGETGGSGGETGSGVPSGSTTVSSCATSSPPAGSSDIAFLLLAGTCYLVRRATRA